MCTWETGTVPGLQPVYSAGKPCAVVGGGSGLSAGEGQAPVIG